MNDYKAKVLKELDTENWHAIEGPAGMCACGSEKGVCHQRLKTFLTRALDGLEAEIRAKVEELRQDENANLGGRDFNAALDDILTDIIPSPSKE